MGTPAMEGQAQLTLPDPGHGEVVDAAIEWLAQNRGMAEGASPQAGMMLGRLQRRLFRLHAHLLGGDPFEADDPWDPETEVPLILREVKFLRSEGLAVPVFFSAHLVKAAQAT